LERFEEQKLLKRNERYLNAGGQTSNEYDLTGLIKTKKRCRNRKNMRPKRVEGKRRGHVE